MSDEPTTDDIESQVAAFAAEIDSGIDINAKGLQDDIARFFVLLLTATDSHEVSSAVLEFSAAAKSTEYVGLVFDSVITSWALWVLREGNVGLFNQYIRHLRTFVFTARAVGVTSTPVADLESFGGSAEDGQQHV